MRFVPNHCDPPVGGLDHIDELAVLYLCGSIPGIGGLRRAFCEAQVDLVLGDEWVALLAGLLFLRLPTVAVIEDPGREHSSGRVERGSEAGAPSTSCTES